MSESLSWCSVIVKFQTFSMGNICHPISRNRHPRLAGSSGSGWLDVPSLIDAMGGQKPTPENRCFLQAFEWNIPADQKHWKRLKAALPDLKAIGIDVIWIPPACKAAGGGGDTNGYDIYDLYDLGEFEQKGSRSTKWGPHEDLMELVNAAEMAHMGIYFDAVLNHKAGADHKEKCQVVEVDPKDRTKAIGTRHVIEAWFGFDFPGRGDKYSSLKWHWEHFSGTDYNASNHKTGVYRIANKNWSNDVDDQDGNADFLMFADVDYAHPAVRKDVIKWGEWIVNECKLSGFRFDAVQHFSQRFLDQFIQNLQEKFGQDKLFLVGEFWKDDVKSLTAYLKNMNHKLCLFDVPLLNTFSKLSQSTNEEADLRKVFAGSLVQEAPDSAVTLVMNHDTQPGQTSDTPIEGFFKPLAYALILLRAHGYPQLFFGDLYGMILNDEPPACDGQLPDLTLARKLYAYGSQEDYFDEAKCIGFIRKGTWDKPAGLACIMSIAGPNQKKMHVGEVHAGQIWKDILNSQKREVKIDREGYGIFPCFGSAVSVFVNRDADGRARFGKFDRDIYGKA
ncbi:hypothetical protein B7494_g6157 [Chlorociboria aeruginascens]|nr:hypothetical protein B7494_g6157 [Chlorociboria aeruginascens]